MRMRRIYARLLISAILMSAAIPAHATVVWSGETFTFTKPTGSDFNDPANRDAIFPDVELTRNDTRGLFNFAQEAGYTRDVSPLGTLWAFETNNPSSTVRATNYQNLVFEDWRSAAGTNPPDSVGQDAVLYIPAEQTYIDIRFLSWDNAREGAFGGFSYIRAVAPIVPGDLTADGIVDIDDLNLAIRNFTGSGGGFDVAEGDGDTDADNDVDNKDLGFIIGEFTNPDAGLGIAQALTSIRQTAVPEPSSFILCGLGGMLLINHRNKR